MKKTAIMLNIEQDESRIKMLENEIKTLEFNHPVPVNKIEQYNARVYELKAQIEDKKLLLQTEREQIEEAHGNQYHMTGKQYYHKTYTQDGE